MVLHMCTSRFKPMHDHLIITVKEEYFTEATSYTLKTIVPVAELSKGGLNGIKPAGNG
ncbi:hypothetical protein J2W91_004642 [Paenibacillus amylolyticus]|uniref:Uncharacterized protein n=2 Tax=Paenibacillus amylolyticus TaxID=1451 RepID=A0AAP5H8Z9_PAEAM|nr:hypothetical protein [Paenibacillus amylolyticus]